MDQDATLRQLANISGGLSPGLGTTAADLQEVHQLLAPATLQGLHENLTAPLSTVSGLGTPLEQLASQESDALQRVLTATQTALAREPLREENLHLFRRELPLLTPELLTSVPTWAAGWGVERSLGPFLDASGQPYWFDIRRSLQQVIIRAPGTQEILLTIPQGRVDADGSFILPAGSVWIQAKVLASSAPDKGYVGLKVQEGRLIVKGSGTVTGGGIVLSAGTELTLELTLAPPLPPSAPASGLGLDARDAVVSLPSSATILIQTPQTLSGHRSPRGGIIASDASVTVYGVSCNLTFAEGTAASYNSELNRMLIPYRCSVATFAPTSVQSQLFQPSGQATVSMAAWALPVAVPSTDVPQLGAAEGLGGLLLVLHPGLQATWSGLRSRVAEEVRSITLAQTFLLIEPGQLLLQAQQAAARRVAQTFQLWQESTTSRRCSIDLEFPQSIAVQFVSSAIADPSEVLALDSLTAIAHLDRPVSADGRRFALHSQQISLIIWENSTGRFMRLGGLADTLPNGAAPTALALRNLYLKTTQPLSLGLFGHLIGPSEVEKGSLRLGFGILAEIPMLPDPYASSWEIPYQRLSRFEPDQAANANLAALVTWDTPTAPTLQLQLVDLTASATLTGRFTPSASDNPARELVRTAPILRTPDVASAREQLLSLFETGTTSGTEAFRLLDVSTNADQFGVSLALGNTKVVINPAARPTIRGLDFVAPANTVRILTLPAFQWEPIRNIRNPNAGPYPDFVVSDTDGGPTRIGIDTVQLVPVAPLPATAELLAAYNDPQQRPKVMALMTLPFGMIALAELQRHPPHFPFRLRQAELMDNKPEFPDVEFTGGLQLSLRAGESPLRGGFSPSFSGVTFQTANYIDPTAGSLHPISALDLNTDTPLDVNFGSKVPVTRIDLSGYGASLFSDWRDPSAAIAEVGQARFDALLGRTAYEVIQIYSYIVGCAARVVRTIIIERTGGGGVFRRDSGWLPVSDGVYDYASLKSKVSVPLITTHPGVIKGFFNIRNIRDTSQNYQHTYPAPTGDVQLAAVLFDADVAIEGVTAGANSQGRVPVRDIVGYVQLKPTGIVLSDTQIDDLLKEKGPFGGVIDCVTDIGGSGQHMRITQFAFDRALAPANKPQVVVAARGTVVLPRVGQWSLTYFQTGDNEPHGLDPNSAIPLIQENSPLPQPYRFADPADLFHPNSPDAEYGFLQSTDVQRLLIRMPKIEPGQRAITSVQPFLLADAYAMLGGVSLFPRPEQCIPLPTGSTLEITAPGRIRLAIPSQAGLAPDSFTVNLPERILTNQVSSLTVRVNYADEKANPTVFTLKINSEAVPDWSISMGPLSLLGDLDSFSGLMRIVGKITSEGGRKASFQQTRLVFGGPLQPVQDYVSFLREIGIPFESSVGLTNTKYKIKQAMDLNIPPPPLEEIDIPGFGKLKGELEWGFGNQTEKAESWLNPRGEWRMYFEMSGEVQSAFLPPLPIYAGGALKVKIEGQSDGPNDYQLMFGVVASVGDKGLIGPFLGAEVSRRFSYVLLNRNTKFDFGIATDLKGSVTLLKGLFGVELSAEFMAIPKRPNSETVTIEAQFTFAAEISLGWIFKEGIELEAEFEQAVDWRLVAALVLGPAIV